MVDKLRIVESYAADTFRNDQAKKWIERPYHNLSQQLFAVISWGAAATSWLSKALNSHPEIFCLHSLNIYLNFDKDRRSFPRNDGLEYLYLIARSAFAYKVIGDVHGISRYDIPEIRKLLDKRFNAVVVVREPLPRLKSTLSHLRLNMKYPLYNVDYVNDIIKNKKLILPHNDYGDRLFVHGVNMLNAIVEENNVGKIYRSEDLTTNKSILFEFIEEITGGKIKTDSELLSNMLKIDKVNKHVKEEIQFDDWQIDVIKSVVSDKAWELYSKCGYDKPSFL